jgi:hypothetical protein
MNSMSMLFHLYVSSLSYLEIRYYIFVFSEKILYLVCFEPNVSDSEDSRSMFGGLVYLFCRDGRQKNNGIVVGRRK